MQTEIQTMNLISDAGYDNMELSPVQYGGQQAANYGGGYGCNASGPWAFQCGVSAAALSPPIVLRR